MKATFDLLLQLFLQLFQQLQYQWDLQNSKGKVTVVQDTPEMLRVKENQKNFSSVQLLSRFQCSFQRKNKTNPHNV